MNITPQAIALIRAHVESWTGDDATIRDALNDPVVDNPTPQANVPRVLYESELATLLNDPDNGSLVKLLNWVNFGLVKADIASQNRAGIALWAGELELLGILTAGEAAAVQGYALTPIPDPAYRAQIGWAEANIGRSVDLADIRAARPQEA